MRARVAASVAVFAAVTALLAGCGMFTPPATEEQYDPSDGINANIGELELRNVIVITEDGEDGNLLMTALNTSDSAMQVRLQWETDGTKHNLEVGVNANSKAQFGWGDEGQLLLEDIGTPAGGLFQLYVQYGDQPGKQLAVPVLDETDAVYQGLIPTPKPTPTPEPTETAEPATP